MTVPSPDRAVKRADPRPNRYSESDFCAVTALTELLQSVVRPRRLELQERRALSGEPEELAHSRRLAFAGNGLLFAASGFRPANLSVAKTDGMCI